MIHCIGYRDRTAFKVGLVKHAIESFEERESSDSVVWYGEKEYTNTTPKKMIKVSMKNGITHTIIASYQEFSDLYEKAR